jgi:hypothetical protein
MKRRTFFSGFLRVCAGTTPSMKPRRLLAGLAHATLLRAQRITQYDKSVLIQINSVLRNSRAKRCLALQLTP